MNVFRTGSRAVCARAEICRKVSQILYLSAQVRFLLLLLLQMRGERRFILRGSLFKKVLLLLLYLFFVSFYPNKKM
jgi:hypothetical protein